MTLLDRPRREFTTDSRIEDGRRRARRGAPARPQEQINVSEPERAVSLAAGSILALLGISRRTLPGLLVGAVGGAMIYRGATGHCPVYESLGLDTARPGGQRRGDQEEEISEKGIHVEQAFLINRPPEELYQFWRNFENLPRIMTHLESVRVLDDRRSHWAARVTRIAGRIEWDAEVVRDEPNRMIAWRSLPDGDIQHKGEIRFTPALGDRGTEVHVFMDYVPPVGQLAQWIPTVFGKAPRRLIREDMRNFKRLMEAGEILTVNGQPHGTCTGQGTRYRE